MRAVCFALNAVKSSTTLAKWTGCALSWKGPSVEAIKADARDTVHLKQLDEVRMVAMDDAVDKEPAKEKPIKVISDESLEGEDDLSTIRGMGADYGAAQQPTTTLG